MENAKTIKGQNRTFRPKSNDAIIPRAREGKKLSISIQSPKLLYNVLLLALVFNSVKELIPVRYQKLWYCDVILG